MSKPIGHQRGSMPLCSEFIDDMRSAFGAEEINAQQARGMKGEPTFWAKENGREIGTRHAAPVLEFSDTWLTGQTIDAPVKGKRK